MRKQNFGFADGTGAPTVAVSTLCLPRTDLKDFTGYPRPYSVQRAAAMPNSTLRNCFHVDVFGSNLGRSMKWGLVAVGLTMSVTQARAEYRVNIGDVLEVAVTGVPELRHRAAVQMDGNVSLPLVGMLPVAGLPLPQIQAKIR